jgi:hypothetical protein
LVVAMRTASPNDIEVDSLRGINVAIGSPYYTRRSCPKLQAVADGATQGAAIAKTRLEEER